MVYLLYGLKEFSINEKIKELIKDIEKLNISNYDLNEDNLNDIINDCETFSLFQDKKIVIVDNANIFTGASSKDSEILENYLNNINPTTTLILVVHNEKIDSRKKITKLVKKNGQIIEYNEEINLEKLVKDLFDGYNIDYKNIKYLIDRVGSNPLTIQNEINKIKLYKKDDISITKEDILNITTETIEIDIFKLIDYIVKDNKEEALKIYNEMLKVNEEPLKIVIMLANQFRIMYQSKELIKKGYSEKSISETLKIHPYRVKLALANSRSYNSKELLKLINDLADIDIGIKTGTVNKDLAIELFILKNNT